jgi:hypothetical protein
VAGKLGGTLPAQKEEALGGWSALRGYGFKEFAGGNFSVLGTVEYRWNVASAFVDVGSLRVGSAFGTVHTSLGLALNLGEQVHVSLAWRADDHARAMPEARLFFRRTF